MILLPHQNPRKKEPSKPGLESVSPNKHFFSLRGVCQAFCHRNAEWVHTHLSYVILFPDHSCLRVNTCNVISAIRPTLPDAAGPPFNTWLAKLQEWGQWPHLLPPHLSIPPVGTLIRLHLTRMTKMLCTKAAKPEPWTLWLMSIHNLHFQMGKRSQVDVTWLY